MEYKDYLGLVPLQHTGTEIESSASVRLGSAEEAKSIYQEAKERLLRVNEWHTLAGMLSAKFQLYRMGMGEVAGPASEGDYLKIDIPGPGSSEGDGYDWVRVESVKELSEGDVDSAGFRVRPAANPEGKKDEVAHFYTEDATSNFVVTREKDTVSAFIVDRNLKPNTKPGSVVDKIRDTSAGIGAIGLFSKIQWKNLADGIIKKTTGS